MRRRKFVRAVGGVAGLGLAACLLARATRDVAWEAFRDTIARIDAAALAGVVAVVAASYLARLLRFRVFTSTFPRPPPTARLAAGLYVGALFLAALPLRLGELVRVAVAGGEADEMTALLGVVVAERLLDTAVLALFLAAGLLGTGAGVADAGGLAFLLAGVGFVLAALLGFHRLRPAVAPVLARFGARLPARLGSFARRFAANLADGVEHAVSGGKPARTAAVVGSTLLIWALEAAAYLALARAMDLQVGFAGCLVVCGLTTFSFLLPASPGGVGLFEFACAQALAWVGAAEAGPALAYAALLHACYLGVIVAFGVVGLGLAGREGWRRARDAVGS